jgi:hypothetical protein
VSLQARERRFGVPEIVSVRCGSNEISSTPAGGFEANAVVSVIEGNKTILGDATCEMYARVESE